MRSKYAMIAILAQLIVTGAALAVTVDVGEIQDSEDITAPAACALNDVTCIYDDFKSGVDSATVDASGVSGTTGGVFVLNFSAPVAEVDLDFSLPGVSAEVTDAVSVICKNKGRDVTDMQVASSFTPDDPAQPALGGSARGKLDYHGAPIDQMFIYFSTDAARFNAANISYEFAASSTPGDVNADGAVDMFDVLVLIETFGTSAGEALYNPTCDLNGDNLVDVVDLLILVDNFGR